MRAHTIRRSRATKLQHAAGELVETLEPRKLLAATFFGGAGLAFNPSEFGGFGVDVFTSEGSIDDETGSVTGDYFVADNGGRDNDGSIPYERVFFLNDGRQERDDAEGFNNFYAGDDGEVNGAQFLSAGGFSGGWWLGDLNEQAQELEFLVELGTGVSEDDFGGTYRYSLLGVDFNADAYFTGSGRMSISGDEIDWDVFAGAAPVRSEIRSVSDLGIARTDEGEFFYRSRDGEVLVFADMDSEDDVIFFGVAIRTDNTITAAELVGGYITAFGYAGPDAEGRGAPNDAVFEQNYLQIEEDGDYKLFDLDDWDSGIRDEPIEEGFWSISNDRLRLDISDSEAVRTLYVGSNANTLVSVDVIGEATISAVLGLATRGTPEGDNGGGGTDSQTVITIGARNGFGREAVYERRVDDMWYESDLVRIAGGPEITGKVVTWVDAKDNLVYAAAETNQGLVLYTQTVSGVWAFRNLTTELSGEAVADSLALMVDPNDNTHLVGLADDGAVLRYYQTGAGNPGNWNWNFQNISDEDLAPNNITSPDYDQDLVAFATSWGGLNIVGLDDEGTIWSTWWAPGLLDWRASDLTTAYGADPLDGGLTVFLTSWNGINIAGLDDSGELRVTWWVPQFGGEWRQSNLTTDANGPTLLPETVSSFVTTWDALNVAGVDAVTGEVVTYWWAPALAETGWAIASLSDIVPENSPPLVDDLTGLAGTDGSLSVFGLDATGDFNRYYWEPTFGGAWLSENITDTATSL
ncbi:MAG: hypothetical protein AAF138_05565 [Planctomycetota bacterium]